MHFEFHCDPSLPRLSWCARVRRRGAIQVRHRAGVDTRLDRFVEGAWDGDFETFDFDRAWSLAGTGGVLRDGSCVFAAPFHSTFMHAGRALAAPARLPAEVLACLSSAVCRALSSPALESAGEAARTPVQAVCAASLQRELRSLEGDVARLAQLAPEAMRRVRQ